MKSLFIGFCLFELNRVRLNHWTAEMPCAASAQIILHYEQASSHDGYRLELFASPPRTCGWLWHRASLPERGIPVPFCTCQTITCLLGAVEIGKWPFVGRACLGLLHWLRPTLGV